MLYATNLRVFTPGSVGLINYPPDMGESIAISMSVCPYVCLSESVCMSVRSHVS